MAKKNFIPLCMIPFIANMMGGKVEGEDTPAKSFVFSEAEKYLGITFGDTLEGGQSHPTFRCELGGDFWNQFNDDLGEFDEEKFDAYLAAHENEYANTIVNIKLIDYVGSETYPGTEKWEFESHIDTENFNIVAFDEDAGTVLGTASCDELSEGAEGHLTGYNAFKLLAKGVTSCNFLVTIDGNAFIVPAAISHEHID